jgi:hypothetical protein
MRTTRLAAVATLAAALAGCGKDTGPVTVTPEMEAKQKEADRKVRDEESARQKNQQPTGKPTAEDEEAARARRQGGN